MKKVTIASLVALCFVILPATASASLWSDFLDFILPPTRVAPVTPLVCPTGYVCSPGATSTAQIADCPSGYTCRFIFSSISIISPTRDQRFGRGSTVPIRWTSQNLTSSVSVDVLTYDGKTVLISSSLVGNPGSYDFLIATSTPFGAYVIRVRGTGGVIAFLPFNIGTTSSSIIPTPIQSPTRTPTPVPSPVNLLLSASCKGFPSITAPNITWSATASGGVGPYKYSWNMSNDIAGYGEGSTQSNALMVSYGTRGVKVAVVHISDANGTAASASCSASVTASTIPTYSPSPAYSPAPTYTPAPIYSPAPTYYPGPTNTVSATPAVCPDGYICTPAGTVASCPSGFACSAASEFCPAGYSCMTFVLPGTEDESGSPLGIAPRDTVPSFPSAGIMSDFWDFLKSIFSQ